MSSAPATRGLLGRGDRSLGPRVTVALTFAVAILSVLTGLADISALGFDSPLATFIPPSIQRTAGFTGALTGFLMIASALGLRRGYRAAWYSTVALLPLTCLQGILQSSQLSWPLIVLSIVAFPSAIYNRGRFTRSLQLTTSQSAALLAIIGVQAYGTLGAYALRDEFDSLNTLVDAFYYTLVTASTVGYGDVAPLSQTARFFGITVVLLGTASFALALGTLLGPLVEARFARALGRMTDENYELLENHVLVLGYGELTNAIVDEIDEDTEYVIISREREELQELIDRGIEVLHGDPSDEAPLLRAGIERARAVLVATNDDGADALSVLTARELNPDVHIVAAASKRENIKKLERAGADEVISPVMHGAQLLVKSSFG